MTEKGNAGVFHVGSRPLRVEDVEAVARRRGVHLEVAAAALERSARGHQALVRHLDEGGVVYGVTTGFGDSCEVSVPEHLVGQLPKNLFRFHGCGVGEDFSVTETRAILLARLGSLASGLSAVRPPVLRRLAQLLNHDILPIIPSIGSVGASGDLTPLSYVAAVLCGERRVLHRGQELSADDALRKAGLEPLELVPKESLAIMNGTSAMTGVAALCLARSLRLARWSSALTAACSDVLRGQPRHYDARIYRAKPHRGQNQVAAWIREDLDFEKARSETPARVQDRYSLRCAPHIIGVLMDLLPGALEWVETELNGANDNPLIDPDSGDVLHGGNFYGGHVCAAMDSIKAQIANLTDLMDRQLALLCNPATNHGLPTDLVGAEPDERAAHHGFKAMQIATSALAAETAKLSMPASVFSRSTENHNQDKVSMGTIAARDCVRSLDLAEITAAIVTLSCVQGFDLRKGEGCHGRVRQLHEKVRTGVPYVNQDREMRPDIDQVLSWYRANELPVGEASLEELRKLDP